MTLSKRFRHMIDEEEARRWLESQERRKREEQERKDAVKKEYLREVAACGNGADESSVRTARTLREAVYNKEYDSVLTILDKAVLPDGHSFGIRICEMESDSLGDWSRPFIQGPDGRRNESVFEFLRFEQSCAGAWQAFLLHEMWHYLPLWWHANYDKQHFLYSPEDLPVFDRPIPYFGKKVVMISPDFSRFDLSPEIRTLEGKYYVSSCFWTNFGGLIREYAVFTLNGGRMEDFYVFDQETLVEYNCGILY